jgi:hypothetical protein
MHDRGGLAGGRPTTIMAPDIQKEAQSESIGRLLDQRPETVS